MPWSRRPTAPGTANSVQPSAEARGLLNNRLSLLRHQRAFALVHRAERLAAGDRADQLVIIPRSFRFRGGLDLVQIHVMDVAAVGADRALAEDRIVERLALQYRHDLVGVVRAGLLDRFEIAPGRRIEPGLNAGRHPAAEFLCEALREGAAPVALVPVERLGQVEALRLLQPETVNVADKHQQAGELLAALDDAELGSLLDRFDRIAAGIGETDDLGSGFLRLQQE